MEQHKSYLLPANTTRKVFVLAVASGVLLFSSSASWKIISVACIPLPSLSYKYEKEPTLFCNGTVFHFALKGHISRHRCIMHS